MDAPDGYEYLAGFATLDVTLLARDAMTSVRSARRWRSSGFAPRIVVAFLKLVHWGDLGRLCKHWDGWRLRNGKLHAPNGWEFDPAELLTIPIRTQENAALRRELAARATHPKPPACSTRRKALSRSDQREPRGNTNTRQVELAKSMVPAVPLNNRMVTTPAAET